MSWIFQSHDIFEERFGAPFLSLMFSVNGGGGGIFSDYTFARRFGAPHFSPMILRSSRNTFFADGGGGGRTVLWSDVLSATLKSRGPSRMRTICVMLAIHTRSVAKEQKNEFCWMTSQSSAQFFDRIIFI